MSATEGSGPASTVALGWRAAAISGLMSASWRAVRGSRFSCTWCTPEGAFAATTVEGGAAAVHGISTSGETRTAPSEASAIAMRGAEQKAHAMTKAQLKERSEEVATKGLEFGEREYYQVTMGQLMAQQKDLQEKIDSDADWSCHTRTKS